MVCVWGGGTISEVRSESSVWIVGALRTEQVLHSITSVKLPVILQG